jgi:hypothetical protein
MRQGLIASAVMLSVILSSPTYASNARQGNDLGVQHWINENSIKKQDVCKHPPIGAGMGPFTLIQSHVDSRKNAHPQAGARLGEILNK